MWSAENKGSGVVEGLRVPGTNRFRASGAKSDAIVEYREREVNVELPGPAFVLPNIDGLHMCP